jgi:hypothetical protein
MNKVHFKAYLFPHLAESFLLDNLGQFKPLLPPFPKQFQMAMQFFPIWRTDSPPDRLHRIGVKDSSVYLNPISIDWLLYLLLQLKQWIMVVIFTKPLAEGEAARTFLSGHSAKQGFSENLLKVAERS